MRKFEHQVVDVDCRIKLDADLVLAQEYGWECCGVFNDLTTGKQIMIMKREVEGE